MKFFAALLDLLFPPKCPFCGQVEDHVGICPNCEKTLPWTEEPHICRDLPGGLRCAAPLWYEDLTREGLAAMIDRCVELSAHPEAQEAAVRKLRQTEQRNVDVARELLEL